MESSRAFLDLLYRRIVWAIALGTLVIALIAFVITMVIFFLTANLFTEILMAIAFATGLGCGLTLFLLARESPLWQAILPFGLAIIACEIAIAIWFPELRLAAAPFLAVVILLAGLNGKRAFTIGVMVACIAVIIPIVALGPDTETSAMPIYLLRFLQASSLAALLVAIWAFLDLVISAQMRALQLAEERANEAEAARQTTEAARREIEQRAIEQQRLLELVAVLELPILPIGDQVLLVPLVGHLDSRRAEQLRSRILEAVAAKRAHTVIIDITGITVIDTAVAKALIDTTAAIRLLGARTIISGIRPAVAQTLVHLNAGLGDITTAPNPEAALATARRLVAA
ncbi:MAG: STAS domain-containing protein [Chloroflexus sp.]|nr:STAS domain-containing protein [Chloroflexus sp.]